MSLTKGPGIDGRRSIKPAPILRPKHGSGLTDGATPRFGVAKPAPDGMVSTMPFRGDGTGYGEGGSNRLPNLQERFGKPTHVRGPRKTNGAPKTRGGTAKGKRILGKVGAGLGAAAAVAGAAYAASRTRDPNAIRPQDRLGPTNSNDFANWDPFKDMGGF